MNSLSNLTSETQALVTSSPQVFTTAIKLNPEEAPADRSARNKKNQRPQIVEDYITKLAKLSNNDNLQLSARVSKLNDLAKKFRSGFPRANNQEFVNKWSPLLTSMAESMANQLIQIEKARSGSRDVGHLDGPDQKKLSEAKMSGVQIVRVLASLRLGLTMSRWR